MQNGVNATIRFPLSPCYANIYRMRRRRYKSRVKYFEYRQKKPPLISPPKKEKSGSRMKIETKKKNQKAGTGVETSLLSLSFASIYASHPRQNLPLPSSGQRPRHAHDDFAFAEGPEVDAHAEDVVDARVRGLVEEERRKGAEGVDEEAGFDAAVHGC